MDPMELDATSTRRKVKFAPKAPPPPRNKAKPLQPKTEIAPESDAPDNEINEVLRRKVNEHLTRRPPKAEKKSPVQVAFAHGVASSTFIRTYGLPREGPHERSDGIGSSFAASDYGKDSLSLPSTAITNKIDRSLEHSTSSIVNQKKRDYKEPWDYNHSYYPVTLPLRKPYSGHPELLDEEEFGEARSALGYDENTIHSASDLGLQAKSDGAKMLFFQLPGTVPLGRQSSGTERENATGHLKLPGPGDGPSCANNKERAGHFTPRKLGASAIPKETVVQRSSPMVSVSTVEKEMVDCSMSYNKGNASRRVGSLQELPAGHVGKMLVYKSGAVKLKLGDVLYDVSPGSECVFAQEVVTINTVGKHCCSLGELNKRAVVTPDWDSLLERGNVESYVDKLSYFVGTIQKHD